MHDGGYAHPGVRWLVGFGLKVARSWGSWVDSGIGQRSALIREWGSVRVWERGGEMCPGEGKWRIGEEAMEKKT